MVPHPSSCTHSRKPKGRRNDGQELVNCEHSGRHCVADHRVLMIKDMFFTRPPPPPILSRAQQLDRFLNSIRKKNTLILGEKLGEPDELYRSEKPL
jgi:hypothetical protein